MVTGYPKLHPEKSDCKCCLLLLRFELVWSIGSVGVQNYVKEFDDFMLDFDTEMDFMANRANFDYYWQEFKQLEATMKKSTNFFSVSEFKYP